MLDQMVRETSDCNSSILIFTSKHYCMSTLCSGEGFCKESVGEKCQRIS